MPADREGSWLRVSGFWLGMRSAGGEAIAIAGSSPETRSQQPETLGRVALPFPALPAPPQHHSHLVRVRESGVERADAEGVAEALARGLAVRAAEDPDLALAAGRLEPDRR